MRVTTYTIFLSRPSDVEMDIEVVKQSIADANFFCSPLNIKFDTFDWRENATPGISTEPQARIDEQSAGYDALIAVLGATLGTPTKNHPSGCVGEIETAIFNVEKSFFKNDSVMVFFKDVQLSLSSDLAEAQRVQDLKNTLGPRGILWRPFSDDESLREAILRSLGVLAARHIVRNSRPEETPPPTGEVALSANGYGSVVGEGLVEELGILDYSQVATDEIEAAGTSAHALGDAMKVFGQIAESQTGAIAAANTSGDKAQARTVISVVAKAMEVCATSMQTNGDDMARRFTIALDAMRSLLELQRSDLSEDISSSELSITVELTSELDETLETVIGQIDGFRETIASIPRLTQDLNSSKKALLRATENLISSMRAISQENRAIYDYCVSSLGS